MPQESINQKNILITGGTSGLGLELVKLFLVKGYKVIAMGRQLIFLPEYEDRFNLFQVDFSDLNQVAFITKTISETYNPGIIINNAGILSPSKFTTTINSLEYTFQVNYLSHLLINEIILSKNKNNDPVKIVTVTSPVSRFANINNSLQFGEESYSAFKAYSSSKLYLTLMCEFLSLRHPGMNFECFSFDPGTFSSGIYRMQGNWFKGFYRIASPFMRSSGKVAKILIEILTSNEIEQGVIYDIRKRTRLTPETDKQKREVFVESCYELLDPYIKQM